MVAPPDFTRAVHAILGLPFDAVDLQGACDVVRASALMRQPCFVTTPNLNFAMTSRLDDAFRKSVLVSDLSLADGVPIIWVARLLGVPLPQRASGASLFERLAAASEPALRVFFFGGPEGAARDANTRLGESRHGLRGVGALAPGFGSIESISDDATIDRINASAADFLVVALGAGKGQAWIMRNRGRLDVPVVSHLGAVVNFAAGRMVRAPRWVQWLQLEWLWRIKEEPSLWRRYWRDGVMFLRVGVTEVLPLALALRWRRQGKPGTLSQSGPQNAPVLRLAGAWLAADAKALRERLEVLSQQGIAPAIDLSEATFLDSSTLGTLMLLHGWCLQSGKPWRLACPAGVTRTLVELSGAGYLLSK